MPSLHIREASAGDLSRIVELKLAMFNESGHAELLAPDARALILQDYKHLYSTNDAQHFIAESEGVAVACAGGFLKSDFPYRYFRTPRYGFVGDVYTEQAFRKQGLAQILSERVLLWLRSKNVRMIRLLASEAGRPLYLKLGFVPSDEMVRVDAI